jgi:hypothetical protein
MLIFLYGLLIDDPLNIVRELNSKSGLKEVKIPKWPLPKNLN